MYFVVDFHINNANFIPWLRILVVLSSNSSPEGLITILQESINRIFTCLQFSLTMNSNHYRVKIFIDLLTGFGSDANYLVVLRELDFCDSTQINVLPKKNVSVSFTILGSLMPVIGGLVQLVKSCGLVVSV